LEAQIMFGSPEPGPFLLDIGLVLALVAVAVVALWVLRRLLRALLVVALVTLIALPVAYPILAKPESGSRSQQTYVADGSVFLDRPAGRASCRGRIDQRYLADPSLTLLVPVPTAVVEANRRTERMRLRSRAGGARIRLVVESEPRGRATTGRVRDDTVVAATARRYDVPLLTADPPTSERRRLWRGIQVIGACAR
jgi:hypothetical protein